MTETPEIRLKRLRMRSMRRGTKEMDLILMRFMEGLGDLSTAELDLYEDLLEENDQDLYPWIAGQATPPDRFRPLISKISALVRGNLENNPGKI